MSDFADGVCVGCVVGVVLTALLLVCAAALVAVDPRDDEEES